MRATFVRWAYRVLVRLYPAEFCREYGDDMMLLFDELVADRGILAATTRTSIDLIVTVPRYRLEASMTEIRTTRMLAVAIAGLLVLGVATPMMGLLWSGPVLIVAGLGLMLANRGRLARAIRTPDSSQRTRRLRLSALSAGVFAAAVVGYVIVIWDEEASTLGLLLPSLLGMAALVGAVWFLIAGLLTPRTANTSRDSRSVGSTP
jgi:hypothetical protein